jgi:hypothetical protein
MATDIIFGERVATGVDAKSAGGGLWLRGDDLKRVSGWEHKPQGFCKSDVCVALPPAQEKDLVANGSYNLAALADLLSIPTVSDSEFNVWCFGEAASERKRALTSLDAPDFTLPDLDGKMHSLSEHRGKKVFLVSWASW